ncbi:MAG TPA: toprim domain-containing protein [archaeon]|nr:toprim domain-containing protein [archaeon]
MLTRLIEELNRIVNYYRGVPIIVEGIKDKRVLTQLGFDYIVDISGTAIDNLADKVRLTGTKSVIILTDFDEEGQSKASRLTNIFQRHHISVLSSVRQRVRSLFKIHKIEELTHFTKLIDLSPSQFHSSQITNITGDDYHGKVSSIHDKIFNRSRVYSRRRSRETRRHRGNIRPD